MSLGARQPLPAGARLGRYVVIEPIGQGERSVVYKAYDPELQRAIAVKVMDARAGDEERLARAGQLMARLAHPNVVAVYDVGTHEGSVFVAMELVAGELLRAWIAIERPWRAIVATFAQVARGLAAADAAKVAHRGFRTTGAIVGADGRARVIGLGQPDAHAGAREATDPRALAACLRDALGDRAPRRLRAVLERAADDGVRQSMDALADALEGTLASGPRRWMFALAGAAALAVTVAAARSVGPARAPICPGAEPQLAGVWDDAVRGATAASFRATGKPYADDALRSATRAIDAYATAWLAMRVEACKATLERGEQSSELMDLRMTCLDRRLTSLRAVTSRFARADAAIVEGAVQAANALAPLSECADAAALRAPTPLPADPAARARIDAVRDRIAEVRASLYTSTPADGLVLASAVVEDANATGYAPVQAEALESQGEQKLLARDFAGGARAFEDAGLAATVGRHPSLETLSWIEMVIALGLDRRVAEGRAAAIQAHARLRRDGGGEERLALLLTGEGRVAYGDARYADAVELQKKALAIRERLLPTDHPDIASSLSELGVAKKDSGDLDGAIACHRRALAIREAAFGPRHPLVAGSLNNLAIALANKGEVALAITLYERAIDIFSAAYGSEDRNVADALTNLGLALGAAGRAQEALDHLQRALDIYVRRFGPEHPDSAIGYGNVAEAFINLQRWDEGIASAQRRLDIQERANGPDYPPLARPLGEIGEALIGKREPARAVPILERAVRLAETRGFSPNVLARARERLAQALRDAHRDPKRVTALVKLARDEFAREGAANDLARLARTFPQ